MDYYQKYLKYKHKYNSTKHKQILTGGNMYLTPLGFLSLSKQQSHRTKQDLYYINLNFNNKGVATYALTNNQFYKMNENNLNTQEVYNQIQKEIPSDDTYVYNGIKDEWEIKYN